MYVVIKRLTSPKGLSLPGGGIERGERREDAIIREMKEETGLRFNVACWMPKTYDKEGRDPRGRTSSCVAIGHGWGDLQDEEGKTRVMLLTPEELERFAGLFVFDHEEIIRDYLSMKKPY